jgi:twinkle protein
MSAKSAAEVSDLIASGAVKAVASRGITQETCRKFGYLLKRGRDGGVDHIAVYRDAQGQPLWAKVRHTGTADAPDKSFAIIGKAGDQFFGQHLWNGGGKRLVIVGGEIDCLTVSQMQDNQWPVVAPGKGEQSLAGCIRANLEWVSSFGEVCIGMDMDPPGLAAAQEALSLLPPGKAKLIKWTMKDPNEMLLGGAGKEIIRCIWNAEQHRPDGIIDARQLTERCLAPPTTGLPWPWAYKTQWTYGRRSGELYLWGAGSGLGKSDYLAEVIAADLQGLTKDGDRYPPQAWGVFAYEAGAATTKKTIAGKIAAKRFHIPDADWTQAQLEATMAAMDTTLWDQGGQLYINDSMGMADWESVKERMRWLAKANGVRHFLVDPVGALVTDADDERKDLDRIALEYAKLMVELEACGYLVSHLTRPSQGPSHEEGGHTSLKQFRGSNGLIMFSSFVFGLERNQQAEDEAERVQTVERVLKDRYTGNSVGKTSRLYYDVLAGTLDTMNMGAVDAA